MKITNIKINTQNIKRQYDKSSLINLWNSKTNKSMSFFVNNKFIRFNEEQNQLILGIVEEFDYNFLPNEKTDELPTISGKRLLEWITLNTEYEIIKRKPSNIDLSLYK